MTPHPRQVTTQTQPPWTVRGGASLDCPICTGAQLGGCLLLLAVMTAVIIPTGRMIGQAVLIGPLTIPAVDQCLSQSGAAAAIASTRNALVTEPNDSFFGPCTNGAVAGEVVAVWSVPPTGPSATESSDVTDTANTDCWREAARFAGLDPVKSRPGTPSVKSTAGEHTQIAIRWWLQVDLHIELIAADSASRRIHRGWLACTVTSSTGVPYTGRVHNAFSGGALPSPFATCQASIEYGGASLPCTSPHPVESLARGDGLGTTEEDLASSCEKLAAMVMRQDDPTENGQLIVLAHREPYVPNNYWQSMPVNCELRQPGDRLLNDTVVGIGPSAIAILALAERPIGVAG